MPAEMVVPDDCKTEPLADRSIELEAVKLFATVMLPPEPEAVCSDNVDALMLPAEDRFPAAVMEKLLPVDDRTVVAPDVEIVTLPCVFAANDVAEAVRAPIFPVPAPVTPLLSADSTRLGVTSDVPDNWEMEPAPSV